MNKIYTVCGCPDCERIQQIRSAKAAAKATATNEAVAENLKPIDPAKLEAWLVKGIRLEREASDPEGILAGLEVVLEQLIKRNAYWAETLKAEVKPLPVLDGIYDQSGLGDAVAALAMAMIDSPSKTFRVVVTEED